MRKEKRMREESKIDDVNQLLSFPLSEVSDIEHKKTEIYKYLVSTNNAQSTEIYTIDSLLKAIKERGKKEKKTPLITVKGELLAVLSSLERDQTIVITDDNELIA